MSLQDMPDERLLREFVTCAVVNSRPEYWGLSMEEARAELSEARAEVLRRMRSHSAEERVVDDVPSPVPKALLSCRPMWDRVEGSD